jgi:uncharacterized protein YkwD
MIFPAFPANGRVIWRCLALLMTLLIALVAQGLLEGAVARERYVAFVQRVNAAPPGGLRFRPDLEQVIANAVNGYRRKQGAGAVGVAASLKAAARAHAVDLALNEEMGHVSSSGQDFDSRMRAVKGGPLFLPSMGENAARDRRKSAANSGKALGLVQHWIGSSGHRRNMINRSFTASAVGVVQKGSQIYAVQIFTAPEVKTKVRRAYAGLEIGGSVY